MWEVFECGKPAKYPEFGVDSSWKKNKFCTLTEAINYADKWLGKYSPGKQELEKLAVNNKYDYTGYEDYIEIREDADASKPIAYQRLKQLHPDLVRIQYDENDELVLVFPDDTNDLRVGCNCWTKYQFKSDSETYSLIERIEKAIEES